MKSKKEREVAKKRRGKEREGKKGRERKGKKKKERKEIFAACAASVADLLCVSILDPILSHAVHVRVSAVP